MDQELEEKITLNLKGILHSQEYHKIPDFIENTYRIGDEIITGVDYDDQPAIILDELTGSFIDVAGDDFWMDSKKSGTKL